MKESAVRIRPKAAARGVRTQDVVNKNICTVLCSAERLIHPLGVEERHQSEEAPVLTAIYPSLSTHLSKVFGEASSRRVSPALLETFTAISMCISGE